MKTFGIREAKARLSALARAAAAGEATVLTDMIRDDFVAQQDDDGP